MAFLTFKRISSISSIIPVVVTIACLAPFVDKAFHIDDPLYIWSAKQIQKNPIDFYGLDINWYGTPMSMARVINHPPLIPYFIAIVTAFGGLNEVMLHTIFLISAVAAAVGTYCLAKQLCSYPALAALATVLTPVFLVSSTNVMVDTSMLALWVWSVVFWLRGIKRNEWLSLVVSMMFIILSALTKYFGIALVGLLFAYSIMQRRKPGVWALILLIPVMVLVGYELLSDRLYGQSVLSVAASFAISSAWGEGARLLAKGLTGTKVLTGLGFIGGCMITVMFYAPLLWSRRVIAVGIALTVLLVFVLSFAEKIGIIYIRDVGGIKWGFLIQIGLMSMTGLSVFMLAGADFWRCRDAQSLLLLLWVVGTFVFVSFINWTASARNILPMAPAVGILLMRRIDHRSRGDQQRTGFWRVAWPLIPAALIAILVCRADYTMAATAREAAGIIRERFKNCNVWFEGHWGFQYYMEEAGCKSIDYKSPRLASGDIIVIPLSNINLEPLPENAVNLIGVLRVGSSRWLTTMNSGAGAGFYADVWGPLPFAIGPAGPEEYYCCVVK